MALSELSREPDDYSQDQAGGNAAAQAFQLPLPLMAACAACEGGVKRAHLVDATTDGALLLELYSRDGIGAMISADFYEARRRPVLLQTRTLPYSRTEGF